MHLSLPRCFAGGKEHTERRRRKQIGVREGKYAPRDAHGNRISRNIYAKTREECEEKMAEMIEKVKREIAEKNLNC